MANIASIQLLTLHKSRNSSSRLFTWKALVSNHDMFSCRSIMPLSKVLACFLLPLNNSSRIYNKSSWYSFFKNEISFRIESKVAPEIRTII